MSASRRLYVALAISATLHALFVMLGWRILVMAPTYTPPVVFPIALVGAPGARGGANPGAAAELAAPAPSAAAPAPMPSSRPSARHATRRAPAAVSTEPASRPGAGGSALGSAGEGGGGERGAGGGGGGAGDGLVAYGANPAPPYPLIARRLGMEGVVLLDILVTPEGRAGDVRVVQSSGHAPLDDVAVRTVRESWRFVPARRDGRPVESRVTVPIRFRLTDDRG